MKLLPIVTLLAGTAASVLGQVIELGAPTNGAVLRRGHNFTAQVKLPLSPVSCVQVGIALTLADCPKGVCPDPMHRLGSILYAGPLKATPHSLGGFYQNFTLEVPTYQTTGPSVFTLTDLCLLGGGPLPLLQFLNATVKVE